MCTAAMLPVEGGGPAFESMHLTGTERGLPTPPEGVTLSKTAPFGGRQSPGKGSSRGLSVAAVTAVLGGTFYYIKSAEKPGAWPQLWR